MITLGESLTYLDVRLEFIRRCNDLRTRGLAESLIDELKSAQDHRLLERVEAMTADQILALNKAA